MSTPHVERLEGGARRPSRTSVLRLARALDRASGPVAVQATAAEWERLAGASLYVTGLCARGRSGCGQRAREAALHREPATQAATDAVMASAVAAMEPAGGDPWPARRPRVRRRVAG